MHRKNFWCVFLFDNTAEAKQMLCSGNFFYSSDVEGLIHTFKGKIIMYKTRNKPTKGSTLAFFGNFFNEFSVFQFFPPLFGIIAYQGKIILFFWLIFRHSFKVCYQIFLRTRCEIISEPSPGNRDFPFHIPEPRVSAFSGISRPRRRKRSARRSKTFARRRYSVLVNASSRRTTTKSVLHSA